MLGVVRKEGEHYWLSPVDKRERREFAIVELGEARARRSGAGRTVGPPAAGHRPGRCSARRPVRAAQLQPDRDPQAWASRMNSATRRSRKRIAVAKLPLGEREDLTHLPIVAIDPVDARDHDDAIWAAPRDDGGGWNAIVAIADVSFYVRPGSELDQRSPSARQQRLFPRPGGADAARGIVGGHLLAEAGGGPRGARLPHGDRQGRDAQKLAISREPKFVSQQILPMKMLRQRSMQARRSTEVASSPCSMPESKVDAQLVEKALKPLWDCWRALLAARNKREPLELDIPERRVVLDEKGRILSVAPRERLDAHRLVEDYMIAANVAAAKALEAKKAPVMYRVHEAPSREKLVALKDYLATFGVEFALGQVISPATFNRIIERVGDADVAARDHGAIAAHPDAGALRARAARPFRAGAGQLRPLHLADPPLCRSARPPRAGHQLTSSARAGCRRARERHSTASASRSRCSSGARWRPSATPSTAMSRPSSPTGSGNGRMPDHRGPAIRLLRHGRAIWAATGWCSPRRSAHEYFRYDETATRSGRRRQRRNLPRRAAAGASRWPRPTRRRARCASNCPKARCGGRPRQRRDRMRTTTRRGARPARTTGQHPASDGTTFSLRRVIMAQFRIADLVGSLREGASTARSPRP